MKLFSSDIEANIKKAIKDMKEQIIAGFLIITLANAGTVYAIIDNNSHVGGDYSTTQSTSDNNKSNNSTNNSNYDFASNSYSSDSSCAIKVSSPVAISDSELEVTTDSNVYEEEKDVTDDILLNQVPSKKYLLDVVNYSFYKELSENDLLDIQKKSFVLEITMDNIDFYSREQIIKYICDKYNLTDFQFKVIASTVYNETFNNNYDDAYRVINTIYNRTKSKKWVNWISSITGLDGTSMYAQVIAPNQFDGCVKNSGYDYDELLNTVIYDGTKPFETTLAAIFDFLISEDNVHNFLSFKGLYYEIDDNIKMMDGFGVTDWVKFTNLGNRYHNPLSKSDLIDSEYELVPIKYKVLTRKRG